MYTGSSIFQGIAIGVIQYYRKSIRQISQHKVDNIRTELGRFAKAKAQAMKDLEELYEQTAKQVGEHQAQLFKSYIQLLSDNSFSNAIESLIRTEQVNAAYAVATTKEEIVGTFAALEDDFVKARIENISNVADRLIAILDGIQKDRVGGKEPVILVAEKISLEEIMEMSQSKLMALATMEGSPVSHTAILAKTKNMPYLLGISPEAEWDGKLGIVDGYTGQFYVEPDTDTLLEFTEKRDAFEREKANLLKLRDAEDITKDGVRVSLYANIGNLDDLDSVIRSGACGIGLLRSEFQYLGRENYPREVELFRAYRKVAEYMGDSMVVIRTVDLGGDKKADYMDLPDEVNPAMGNRGIRICLDRKKMFKAQLRAIYRASAYGNLSIMYPMITSLEEMLEIREIVREVKEGLRKKEIPFKNIPQGIMIETPAAVMICRELAKHVQFISLGTNDLSQYILAMDRQNPHLKQRYNEHHPAILRMIRMAVEDAHLEGCQVGICGELATDFDLIPEFLKMGVDSLSMAPACILPVRKLIRETVVSEEE